MIDHDRLVKAECLRLLAALRLDLARTRLISGFVDTDLCLNATEEQVFQAEIDTIDSPEREEVMQIVTSWMQQGIEQGTRMLVLRQLDRRFGQLSQAQHDRISTLNSEQLDQMAIALLDFSTIEDLESWLSGLS
jgi:hypothetical protein